MIVSWISIQSQPLPWEERRTDLAYVACGERCGELALVRASCGPQSPGVERLLRSLEEAVQMERDAETPSLDWVRKAVPDQGTSIRLSGVARRQAGSYAEGVRRLAGVEA